MFHLMFMSRLQCLRWPGSRVSSRPDDLYLTHEVAVLISSDVILHLPCDCGAEWRRSCRRRSRWTGRRSVVCRTGSDLSCQSNWDTDRHRAVSQTQIWSSELKSVIHRSFFTPLGWNLFWTSKKMKRTYSECIQLNRITEIKLLNILSRMKHRTDIYTWCRHINNNNSVSVSTTTKNELKSSTECRRNISWACLSSGSLMMSRDMKKNFSSPRKESIL